MIKVGIIGADTLKAGELIRLLINHSETELITLYAPSFIGRSVSSVHHGLIGEKTINFSDKIQPDELDIIFIAEINEISKNIIDNQESWPDLKIIDLTQNDDVTISESIDFIGLSEINRKNLVRGAKKTFIPTSPLISPLISLVPLAQFMLLNAPISIIISMPSGVLKENNNPDTVSRLLRTAFTFYQPSFSSEVNVSFETLENEDRVMVMKAKFDCSLSIEEVEKIYDRVYDDHNFTFITHSPVSIKEVEGTQKCIISINKPSSATLEITTMIDGRMRGGAGDAVHVMNLLQGLYEKTGLQLKSSAYESPYNKESSSWFA